MSDMKTYEYIWLDGYTPEPFMRSKVNAPPKTISKIYSIQKQNFVNPSKIDEKNLFIFENNLSFELSEFKNIPFQKVFLINNKNENREDRKSVV